VGSVLSHLLWLERATGGMLMLMPPAKDLGNREEVPCHCAKANKVENKGRGGDSTGFWCNSVACCGRTSGEKCERRCRRRRAERRRQEDAEDNGSSRRPKPSLRRSAAANTGNWIKAGSRRGVGLEHLRNVVDPTAHHVQIMRTAERGVPWPVFSCWEALFLFFCPQGYRTLITWQSSLA
jgi:hypothetical protein